MLTSGWICHIGSSTTGPTAEALLTDTHGLSFMLVRMSGGGHGAGAQVNWWTEGWVAREERAGGGSSIRVGSGRKRGK